MVSNTPIISHSKYQPIICCVKMLTIETIDTSTTIQLQITVIEPRNLKAIPQWKNVLPRGMPGSKVFGFINDINLNVKVDVYQLLSLGPLKFCALMKCIVNRSLIISYIIEKLFDN